MSDTSELYLHWAAKTTLGTSVGAGGTDLLPLMWRAAAVGLHLSNTSWVGEDRERHQIPLMWSAVVEIHP